MFTSTSRCVRADEAAILEWMLTNASHIGPLHDLAASVPSLNVQDRCLCGCCSVAFVNDGRSSRCQPIASASGRTALGISIDVRVWGTSGTVTALEMIGETSSVDSLPLLESLRPSSADSSDILRSVSRRSA